MKENLFSYGTLQTESVQTELFGRLLDGRKDRLKGYKPAPVEIEDKTFLAGGEKIQRTLIPSNDNADLVEGNVFEVSIEELHAADKYEPANYKRIRVGLESGIEAWIYIAV